MSADPGDQPHHPPAAKLSSTPPPPPSSAQTTAPAVSVAAAPADHAPDATTAHELRRHADATTALPSTVHSSSLQATPSSQTIPASSTNPTTNLPPIGPTTTTPTGIHVAQPSTYLGTYVRPRSALAERPMTPSSLLAGKASAIEPPLSLVDREQIEGLVSDTSSSLISWCKGIGHELCPYETYSAYPEHSN
jgi:hypothetical protein